jgi:LysR family transcriptional regulator, transcriptional activator of nhaA
VNFNHLHYFYLVVREGSVSAASRSLKLSQPSLSAQIKTFEQSLGEKLFERKGNRLELTALGREVYSSAAQMFEIASAIPKLLRKGLSPRIMIKLGIADEIERPFAVSLVRNLFQQWTQELPPTISFTAGQNEDLIAKLRSWNVDAVITNRPSSFEDLEIAGTMVMPVFFAAGSSKRVRKNINLCPAREIPRIIQSLGKELSVPTTRLKLREEIDSFLSKTRESYSVIFESDTIAAIVRSVIDNVGVGFVPLPYISREVAKKDISIYGPKEGLWKHTLFLMTKRGRGQAAGLPEITEAFENLRKNITKDLNETI